MEQTQIVKGLKVNFKETGEGKPVIGMSSFEGRDAPAPIDNFQFDAFLTKPLHPKKLAATLRRLLLENEKKLATA